MTDIIRSSALNDIPKKKLDDHLEMLRLSSDDLQTKNLKITAALRFAESNIPMLYWDLKMEKDFHGDKNLMKEFELFTQDLKQTFVNGTSLCLAGPHGVGKQICLETELPTPTGFIKLKDLKEGDQLFDETGSICNVLKLHPIQVSPKSYRIYFDDGSTVDACEDHLWLTQTRIDRVKNINGSVKTTKEIYKSLSFKNGIRQAANHSIICADPIKYPKKQLPIDPYVLGCWLGDGSSNEGAIECADQEILDNIEKCGYPIILRKGSVGDSKSRLYRIGEIIYDENKNNHPVGKLTFQLNQLGLIKNKHIPEEYLYSSYEQRLSLLQGLMDTDGCCTKKGLSEFCSITKELAEGVCHLVRSLGIKCKINKNKSFLYGKRCNDRYRITFTTILPVFRLKRKLENIRLQKAQQSRTTHRFIVKIKKIKSKPMRCITVDSASHLFLITRNFIATHNTMVSSCILKKASLKGFSCLFTTLSDVVSVLTQGEPEEKFAARKELKMVDFLVLDEVDPRFIGSDNASDLFGRNLESIFRTRVQNKLPTIICTNSPNVVESFGGNLKQSLGSLMSVMKTVVVMGEDHRKIDPQNGILIFLMNFDGSPFDLEDLQNFTKQKNWVALKKEIEEKIREMEEQKKPEWIKKLKKILHLCEIGLKK